MIEDFLRHRWQTLSCEYLREFSKKFETTLMVYSGAWGKLIREKNQKSKISWHCPFKGSDQWKIRRVGKLASVRRWCRLWQSMSIYFLMLLSSFLRSISVSCLWSQNNRRLTWIYMNIGEAHRTRSSSLWSANTDGSPMHPAPIVMVDRT